MSSALRLTLSASRLAAFLIALLAGQTQVAHAASAQISLEPTSLVVQPGGHMNVAVQLSTDVAVRGLQFMLRYDPRLLHIDGVYDGNFFADWAAQNGAHAQTVFPFTPDNEHGITTVGGIALFGGPPTAGPVGSGTVVKLQVTVPPDAANGTTTSIEFDKVILADTQAKEVSGATATGATLQVGPPGASAPAAPTPFVVPQVGSQASPADTGLVWARRNTMLIGIVGGGLVVAAVVYALVLRTGRAGHALAIAFCLVAFCSLSVTPAHAANTSVTISPPSVAANPGDQLKLDVILSSDVPTRGMQFGLTFDPNVIQIDKVVDGPFYQSWASAHGAQAQTVVPFKPDNAKGAVSVGGVAVLGGPPTDGPSGSGIVVTLQVTAKSGAQGVSQIGFTSVIVDDANSREIPAVASTGAAVGVGVDASSIGGPSTTQALPPTSTDIRFRLEEGGQPSSQSVQVRNGTPVTSTSESAPAPTAPPPTAVPAVAPTLPAATPTAPAIVAPTAAPLVVSAAPTSSVAVAPTAVAPTVGSPVQQAAASIPTATSQNISLAAVPTVASAPVQVGGAQAFQSIATPATAAQPVAAQQNNAAPPQLVAATPTLGRLPVAAPVTRPRGTAGVFLPWELLAGIGGGIVSAGLILLALRVHDRGVRI